MHVTRWRIPYLVNCKNISRTWCIFLVEEHRLGDKPCWICCLVGVFINKVKCIIHSNDRNSQSFWFPLFFSFFSLKLLSQKYLWKKGNCFWMMSVEHHQLTFHNSMHAWMYVKWYIFLWKQYQPIYCRCLWKTSCPEVQYMSVNATRAKHNNMFLAVSSMWSLCRGG